jgi:MFS family permease
MVAMSLIIGTPFFIVFGSLSDKIGRKWIILGGCLLAVLTYFPVFEALTKAANPDLYAAQQTAKVTVTADPAECSFQFNPTGTKKFTSSCDIAKQRLAGASVSYDNVVAPAGTPAVIKVGETVVNVKYSPEDVAAAKAKAEAKLAELSAATPVDEKAVAAAKKTVADLGNEKTASATLLGANLGAALKAAGYPAKADMAKFDKVKVVIILTYLVILVTMVYGPIAAMLVEMFPTRIRYTSMSLPYHIGNGWFGGLLPTTAFAIVAQTGNMYNGLWYPIIIAGATVVIGGLFVKETKDVDIYAND